MEEFPTPGRLLFWPEVRERVGISRTTAWRLQNAGVFPLPVEISAGRVGWREEDIAAWTASLAKRERNQRRRAPTEQPAEETAPKAVAAPEAVVPRPLRFKSRRGPSPVSRQLGFDF